MVEKTQNLSLAKYYTINFMLTIALCGKRRKRYIKKAKGSNPEM